MASKHFKRGEFRCRCCASGDAMPELYEALEELREKLGGRPITIVSGVRCHRHNSAVGGARMSQHLFGRAADIAVRGVDPSTVYSLAKEVHDFAEGGIGKYDRFVHVDVRGRYGLKRARWNG